VAALTVIPTGRAETQIGQMEILTGPTEPQIGIAGGNGKRNRNHPFKNHFNINHL
jgi:hypothetical protein